MFEHISKIDPKKKDTWKNNVFITLDVDWACDEVLSFCLDILLEYNIKATIFITHKTKLIDKIINSKNFEAGIHPNFNFLLNGDFRYGKTYKEVINFYKNLVPNSTSMRSHSITQSSNILDYLIDVDIKHECNLFIPYTSNIKLAPYMHYSNSLTHVPYFWEDDVFFNTPTSNNFKTIESKSSLKVYNFHPIHIFLNTEKMSRYLDCKQFYKDPISLKPYINRVSYGTYNFLKDVITYNKQEKVTGSIS